jgi:membrane protein YqaA with SNARE-associated domain
VFDGPFAIDTATWWLAIASSFALGFLVGALPVGASEAVVLGIGTIPSHRLRAIALVTFTAGHVLGKLPWYWLGTVSARITWARLRAAIDRAHAVVAAHPAVGPAVTFTAAAASLPPFHLTVIAAGIVRAPLAPCLTAAFAGRLVRFSVIAAFPALVGYLIGPSSSGGE